MRVDGQGEYRPYPAYKASSVERLGEVPAHWEVKKATWLFSIGSGTTPASGNMDYYDGDMPWVTTGELRENTIIHTEKRLTQLALREHPSLRIYPVGSLAIAMYGATIGRLGIFGIESSVNQACCVFSQPQGIDIQFTFYWLQMRRPYLISLGYGGGQPNLSQELLRSLRIPTPPLTEQQVIGRFLDHKTSEIDTLIAAKQRLITLLQENRAALITQTVSKGLDPSVTMKDSAVEWLGEIPAHWEMLRLRYVTDKFVDYRGRTPEKTESGIPLITARNIGEGFLDFSLSQEYIREEDYSGWMVRGLPEIGDVLLTTEAPLGHTALIEDTYVALAQRLMLIKGRRDKISHNYLMHYFLSGVGQCIKDSCGAESSEPPHNPH